MSNRNPNSMEVEKEYVFEIHGEIVVSDYSEEQAKEQVWDILPQEIKDAMDNNQLVIN